jgi:hypothetical protein
LASYWLSIKFFTIRLSYTSNHSCSLIFLTSLSAYNACQQSYKFDGTIFHFFMSNFRLSTCYSIRKRLERQNLQNQKLGF